MKKGIYNMEVKLTGLSDVDQLLKNGDIENTASMPIDKSMFDSVILPLLTGVDTTIDNVDERFEHLKNIWNNYYKDYSGRKTKEKLSGNKPGVVVNGNGVFYSMTILDIDGTVVATTPPLLEPFTLENGTLAAIAHKKAVETKLLTANNIDMLTEECKASATKSKWTIFLDSYLGESVDEINTPAEENNVYSLGEE